MSDDAKCYAATPAKTIEQHIMDPNIAKNEAEWWAYHEIERLRAENDSLKSVIEDNAKLVLHIRMENEALRAALKKWEDTGLQKDWPITYDENTQGCWLAEAGAAKAALGE